MKGARPLTPLEVQAVYLAFGGKYAVRNRTLFLLCVNTGLRISEALALKVGDVWQNEQIVDYLYLKKSTQKGNKEGATLKLPSGAKNALRSLIEWKKEKEGKLKKRSPLFESRQGGNLTRQQAHNIFSVAYNKVGLTGQVTTHSPRKTYAKEVYSNSGKDLVTLQHALRHKNIVTTIAYLDTKEDEVSLAMPNYDFDTPNNTSNSKIIRMDKPSRSRQKSAS